ncbi:MAG TPA: hypothetical protein VGK19_01580 [Capsulimonadaceae bacterium]|jgi:hypothetical protein
MTTDLPDLLALPSGWRASNAAEWTEQCRPHLLELVQREEYGVMPPVPGSVTFTVVRTDPAALDGQATLREIDIVTTAPDAHLELIVFTPNSLATPAPCFVGLNFGGNHRLISDPLVRPSKAFAEGPTDEIDAARGTDTEKWPVGAIIERGYALATLHNGDAIPDDAGKAAELLPSFTPPGVSPTGPEAPGALACWAWTLSRAIDFLLSDPSIDPNRIALVGHSRNGKTALLAAATDPRAALVIPCQSGTGGVGPSRAIGEPLDVRETVARINTIFPHWFCGNFKRYNDATDQLPFDQHAMVALCAPRPLLLSSATDDLWANPAGSLAMLQAADPVYRLLGVGGIDIDSMSKPGELVASRLGHYIRNGDHRVTLEDWTAWMNFADVWL